MHHSCDSVFSVIRDLANMGADIIHPIQALSAEMDASNLKKHFDSDVAFCSGVDDKNLLVNMKLEYIQQTGAELKELFSTGLIFSPNYEAVLPVCPANIRVLFDAVKKFD
jgi:uroporphyrinogen decarboxylase